MKNIINFQTLKAAVKAEFAKSRIWVNILSVIAVSCIFIFVILFILSNMNSQSVTHNGVTTTISGAFVALFGARDLSEFNKIYFGLYLFFVAPFILAFITSSLANIETKNKTLSFVLMQPINRVDVFLAKVIMASFYALLSVVTISIVHTIAYFYLSSKAGLPSSYNSSAFVDLTVYLFSFLFFSLPVIMLHILLGLRFKLNIVNMMIFLFFSLSSGIYIFVTQRLIEDFHVVKSAIYTYTSQFISIFSKVQSFNDLRIFELIGYNLILIIIISGIGHYWFNKDNRLN